LNINEFIGEVALLSATIEKLLPKGGSFSQKVERSETTQLVRICLHHFRQFRNGVLHGEIQIEDTDDYQYQIQLAEELILVLRQGGLGASSKLGRPIPMSIEVTRNQVDVNNLASVLGVKPADIVVDIIEDELDVPGGSKVDLRAASRIAQAHGVELRPENKVKLLLVDGPFVVVKDLAHDLDIRPNQLIAELMAQNVFAGLNQKIDIKIAAHIADRHGFRMERQRPS